MPRVNNEYSVEQTISPEAKSISAKRLYRGVLECVRKLDAGRQHRRNLISLFQAEQVKLRHKLREACEKLMFMYPSDYGRKAEELLWKKVYYDVIHAVKTGRKFQSNAPGALQQQHLEPYYRQFLYSAIGFYHYLLLRLQSRVKPGVASIDFPLASRALHRNSSLLNDQHGLATKNLQEEEERDLEGWVKTTSYRILLCLGDLSRYQMEFGGSRSRASRYYQLALLARPDAGMPHNQLATIAGHHSWWGLTAAYHYCRSLQAETSFDGAEGNLQNLLDRNKKLFYQLPVDALDGVITAGVYKREHTRIFIISFLYLCDLLRPKTYSTDVETTGLCKRLIDALHVCLNHMNTEATDEPILTEDVSSSGQDNIVSAKHKNESKRYGLRSSVGSVEKSPSTKSSRHHHSHQQRLSGDIVFKMSVMCLVNVHDLQTGRSNRSSAAIAFVLAFLSHLLGYLIQQLTKPAEIKKDAIAEANDEEKLSKADGDNACEDQEKNASGKNKKNKCRMRRRRRVGGMDDLSEGEEDLMGGGDAATDSELSDSEIEDESETLSESSGSDNRLSQEEISSQEDEGDVNENSNASSKTQDKKEKSHSVIGSPPSLAVASLQDLSNKMFQPANRRKITLAPSFLQHLNTKQDSQQTPGTTPSKPGPEIKEHIGASELRKEGSLENTSKADKNMKNSDKEEMKVVEKNFETEDERLKREQETFDHLFLLARHHHVLAAVKLLADWLALNERVAAACAKNSRALWNRLVCLINFLPTEREMMKRDEICRDAICSSQVKNVLHALEKCESDKKTKANEKAKEAANESSSKEKKIKIEKRKTTEHNEAKKPPPFKIITALPEDHAMHMMKAVKESAVKTGVDVSLPYKELSDLQQCVLRTCRLRHLCRALSSIEGVEIDFDTSDGLVGNEHFTGPEEEAEVDPQLELEAVEAMRKDRLMKDMAASRLRNEVQALESSLGAAKSRDSAMCLYLVPDTSSLCHELAHIRRLVLIERFFVIISKTVIDGLDSLKKELQGARDAIRYLETEFKKSNRFVRAQLNDEIVKGVPGERPKLRRQDIDAWRFYRITECCRYLLQQEANKNNTEVKEHSGLVTILTHERDSHSQQLSAAMATAKSFGIQVTSASAFSKSWSQTNS